MKEAKLHVMTTFNNRCFQKLMEQVMMKILSNQSHRLASYKIFKNFFRCWENYDYVFVYNLWRIVCKYHKCNETNSPASIHSFNTFAVACFNKYGSNPVDLIQLFDLGISLSVHFTLIWIIFGQSSIAFIALLEFHLMLEIKRFKETEILIMI